MLATAERTTQVPVMSDTPEVGTKTVRINGEAVKKLQTISALKDQMGQRFKPVEFLDGLVVSPIDALYEETVAEFTAFKDKDKGKGKPKK